MTAVPTIDAGTYSHDLLLHDGLDETLVESTREFVGRALDSGGRVLVHGDSARVGFLRRALGSPAGLTYGVDRHGLYLVPMRTLFEYQDSLAGPGRPVDVWSTGPVPLGGEAHQDAAWLRYEAAVNEALGPYPFHGLCTYDRAVLPAATIAAARATHPHLTDPSGRTASREYMPPADYLAGPFAAAPAAPAAAPTLMTILDGTADLVGARRLLVDAAAASLLPGLIVDSFVAAVHEVSANGLVHGLSAVEVRIWAEPGSLTCEVSDDGPGVADPLAGFTHPSGSLPAGLWVARRLCDEVVVTERPEGGTRVLLVVSA